MTPRALKYGFRYYYDEDFRKKKKNREITLRGRKRYGTRFYNNRKNIIKYLIRNYGKKCQLCDRRLKTKEITVDHIVPVSKGGTHDIGNLQILCHTCHTWKDSPKKSDAQFNIMKEALEKAKLLENVKQ